MMNKVLIELGIRAGDVVLRNSTEAIFKKIESAKADSDKDKTIIKMDEIITELIEDRNELNRIVKEYDEILSMQKISQENVTYITDNLIPIINQLMQSGLVQESSSLDSDSVEQFLELLKPILSIETFTILQLLGFNFREAIGIPLTKTVTKLIDSKNSPTENFEYHKALNDKEKELYRLLQTEEGREIYRRIANL